MSKRPTVLMILDGYGLNDRKEANAIAEANTPVMDKLMAEYPYAKGNASGLAVGCLLYTSGGGKRRMLWTFCCG